MSCYNEPSSAVSNFSTSSELWASGITTPLFSSAIYQHQHLAPIRNNKKIIKLVIFRNYLPNQAVMRGCQPQDLHIVEKKDIRQAKVENRKKKVPNVTTKQWYYSILVKQNSTITQNELITNQLSHKKRVTHESMSLTKRTKLLRARSWYTVNQ